MPWAPELFSAPAVESLLERRRTERLTTVPYFDGIVAGEPEALADSFVGEPELYHPVRGRIKGRRAFVDHVVETAAWIAERHVTVEDLRHFVTDEHGFEEVLLHLDGENGRIELPVAIVGDGKSGGRIGELRMYFSSWGLTGRHAIRPPVLQRDPGLRESDLIAEYQAALAAGDLEAILATFEPDGYAREPAGGRYVHRGPDGLRAFYAHLFSNGGGIALEHCTSTGDDKACALEYNVVRWGRTDLPPQAGVAVYVRGPSRRIAAARIYDDADPPLAPVE
jgi:hypothetical protein